MNAFIVRKNTPGFTPTKIENKIALRCVQNADMLFERCFIPDSARLPGVNAQQLFFYFRAPALCSSVHSQIHVGSRFVRAGSLVKGLGVLCAV